MEDDSRQETNSSPAPPATVLQGRGPHSWGLREPLHPPPSSGGVAQKPLPYSSGLFHAPSIPGAGGGVGRKGSGMGKAEKAGRETPCDTVPSTVSGPSPKNQVIH